MSATELECIIHGYQQVRGAVFLDVLIKAGAVMAIELCLKLIRYI
jgi:hypothetical protein